MDANLLRSAALQLADPSTGTPPRRWTMRLDAQGEAYYSVNFRPWLDNSKEGMPPGFYYCLESGNETLTDAPVLGENAVTPLPDAETRLNASLQPLNLGGHRTSIPAIIECRSASATALLELDERSRFGFGKRVFLLERRDGRSLGTVRLCLDVMLASDQEGGDRLLLEDQDGSGVVCRDVTLEPERTRSWSGTAPDLAVVLDRTTADPESETLVGRLYHGAQPERDWPTNDRVRRLLVEATSHIPNCRVFTFSDTEDGDVVAPVDGPAIIPDAPTGLDPANLHLEPSAVYAMGLDLFDQVADACQLALRFLQTRARPCLIVVGDSPPRPWAGPPGDAIWNALVGDRSNARTAAKPFQEVVDELLACGVSVAWLFTGWLGSPKDTVNQKVLGALQQVRGLAVKRVHRPEDIPGGLAELLERIGEVGAVEWRLLSHASEESRREGQSGVTGGLTKGLSGLRDARLSRPGSPPAEAVKQPPSAGSPLSQSTAAPETPPGPGLGLSQLQELQKQADEAEEAIRRLTEKKAALRTELGESE